MRKSARDPSVDPGLSQAAAAVAVGQNIPVSVSLLYGTVPSVIGKGCHISFPVRKLCKVPRTVILRPCGAAAGVGNGSQMVFLIIGITGPDPRPFLFCDVPTAVIGKCHLHSGPVGLLYHPSVLVFPF